MFSFVTLGFGAIGWVDDYRKVVHRNPKGLSGKAKFFWQSVFGVGAAIYINQVASPREQRWVKPAIEFISAIPSVVLGFFGLMVMASLLQGLFGYESRLNAFVAGLALGLAVIPVVFSIAEDALTVFRDRNSSAEGALEVAVYPIGLLMVVAP